MPKSTPLVAVTKPTVNILGTRGIPASHGGFETFAAHLAPYLAARGWTVNVYCQIEADDDSALQMDFEDDWYGVHRIHRRTKYRGAVGTIHFDWRCVLDVINRPGVDLVLGYNTAVFSILQRLAGRRLAMNMDGIEWKRSKWPVPIKVWFYFNEFVGSHIATVPIADHPEIATHLRRHGRDRATVVPYGADAILSASDLPVKALGLEPGGYFLSIARVEPENSTLEIVRSFSKCSRGARLAIVGLLRENVPYHRAVREAASPDVHFLGPVYDKPTVSSLRYHAKAYVHGHQVGGTNPSLVEALGAGSAVIAHNNKFNRWVAGDKQIYFSSNADLDQIFSSWPEMTHRLAECRIYARSRHSEYFMWDEVLSAYEKLLGQLVLSQKIQK